MGRSAGVTAQGHQGWNGLEPISGPWGVVDKGTGKASTGTVGSKHEVKGVALTPNPPAPAGLEMAEGGKVEG